MSIRSRTMTRSTSRAHPRRMFVNAVRHVAHAVNAYVSPLGWAVGLSAAACLGSFAWLGWHELLAFGITAAVMLVFAVVLSLGNTSFTAHLSASSRHVTVGDDLRITIDIDNTGATATASAQGNLPIGDEHEWFGIPMLAPRQAKRTELTFRTMQRAILPIGPLHIRKGDPFGLIRHDRRLAERIIVYIHPKTISLRTVNAGIPRDLEGRPSGQIVDDDLDFHGLREYTPGDDVRNVHWLSSAKTGSLMIRQYEATKRTDTSLTISVNPNGYATAQEFELGVSIHASIGVACLAQHRPVSMHAGTRHVRPRNAMLLLDETSGIAPSRQGQDHLNPVQSTLEHSPDASCYMFVVGSLITVDQLKRATQALPPSARCVVLQASVGAYRSMEQFAHFTLATVGELDDLPLIMEALA